MDAHDLAMALRGTWRVAKLDAAGLDAFGNDPQAVWKSFWPAYALAPLYFLLVSWDLATQEDPQVVRGLLVEGIGYVIGWLALPVLLLQLARLLEIQGTVLRFIAAHNWFSLIRALMMLPLTVLVLAGLFPLELLQLLWLMAVSALVMYEWFIARHGLQVGGGFAVGVAALDFILQLLINAAASLMA